MRQVPEYDLGNSSTWAVMRERDAISEHDRREFEKGLADIAAFNPFRRPTLRLVWGATHYDPQSVERRLKYWLCDTEPVLCGFEYREGGERKFSALEKNVPRSVLIVEPKYESHQLGERRFIVEEWRSAQFLKRSGRYSQTSDPGQTATRFECRNCGSFVPTPAETVNWDVERTCRRCGSKRVSPADEREDGEGRLLRPVPAEGVYDFFFRLEREDGTYHPPDGEALEGVRRLWEWRCLPRGEREAAIRRERERKAKEKRESRREIWHVDNLLKRSDGSLKKLREVRA